MNPNAFKEAIQALRDSVAPMVTTAYSYKEEVSSNEAADGQNKGEMIANIMLGIRHLEDAAMRFGKAIQASEGGTSPLGGPKTPGQ